MRIPLFGRMKTSQEIEREVTDQIEAIARSGHNPPPPEWTVLGGLPVTEAAPLAPPPAPTGPENAVGDQVPGDDPPAPARRVPAKATARASAAKKPAARKPAARKPGANATPKATAAKPRTAKRS
jgi:hypothetical protein